MWFSTYILNGQPKLTIRLMPIGINLICPHKADKRYMCFSTYILKITYLNQMEDNPTKSRPIFSHISSFIDRIERLNCCSLISSAADDFIKYMS